jgi:hypothetical protein
MTIVTVGIDLAKNIFAVHGVDATGKPSLVHPCVTRNKLLELIAALPACLIDMDACSGAHHWAREFQKHGHTVRLMTSKLVAPYRLSGNRGKNNAADAAAICEAVTRARMRFVPIKSIEQQGPLMAHRARQGFVEQRTATFNRIRGLFWEFPCSTCPLGFVVRHTPVFWDRYACVPWQWSTRRCWQRGHRLGSGDVGPFFQKMPAMDSYRRAPPVQPRFLGVRDCRLQRQ